MMTPLDFPEWTPIPAQDSGQAASVVDTVAANGIGREPLARITSKSAPKVFCRPQYHRQGVAGALKDCWVRQTVLAKLVSASEMLAPGGLTLIVWDAWRPPRVQQALYDGYADALRAAHPDLSPDALATRVQEFVARPSADPLRPPPHLTGGAVDVTLGDAAGRPLWMGTEYDDFSPRAHTRFFETLEVSASTFAEGSDDAQARENRRALYHIMTEQGFTNYHAEWWHFDFGNRLWAQVVGVSPIYGPIEPV